MDLVNDAVLKCTSCRKWSGRPIRPIARMSLAESFNDIVFLDVIYYHRIGTPNVQKLYGHLTFGSSGTWRIVVPRASR